MRDNDVLLEYGYNNRRLLESERLSGFSTVDWTTNHEYDANGFLAATIYPDDHRVEFAPNALGQATKTGVYAVGASYFPNGAQKQFTYGNGHVHTLTQNERGLPETSRDAMGSTVVLEDMYLYDENGNVAAIDDRIAGSAGERAMTYDDLDRLVIAAANSPQGGTGTFAYDALDNIRQLDQGARTVRHAYAAYNRLTSVANAAGTTLYTYDYDDRGNQTTRTGTYVDTFTFDDANRLTASTVHSATGVATSSTYLYDGLHRRVREIANGSTYSHYGQDGKLIYQSDLTTTPDERHVYVYLAGSLVAKRTLPVGGTIYTTYQHTDALGSPVATTDQAGTTITRERLTAYGEPADGTWKRGPGFTGHVMDPGSRLVYMQQRYYDPAVGRFLSVDPVATNPRNGANFNRYWYAQGNPVAYVDPDGRRPNKAGATDAVFVARGLEGVTDMWGHAGSFDRLDDRYFYTETYGWIDAKHFFAAAHLERQYRFDGVARATGVIVEIDQKLSENSSAFSPEDLPSNEAGIDFGNSIKNGESVRDAFSRWSGQNGAMYESAFKGSPQFQSLPDSEPQGKGAGSRESTPESNVTKEPKQIITTD